MERIHDWGLCGGHPGATQKALPPQRICTTRNRIAWMDSPHIGMRLAAMSSQPPHADARSPPLTATYYWVGFDVPWYTYNQNEHKKIQWCQSFSRRWQTKFVQNGMEWETTMKPYSTTLDDDIEYITEVWQGTVN